MPLRGALLLVSAAALFSVMSLLVKLAGETLPSPMLVLARAVVTLVLSIAWLRRAGVSPLGNAKGLLLLRGGFGFLGLLCFFYAVTKLPLAEATVLHYLNPVFTAILAAVVLKERVRWPLVAALALSSAGTLLVARPAAFVESAATLHGLGVLAALGGALASAAAYVTVRKLRETDDPLVIVFYFSVVAVPASIPFVAPVFVMPRGVEWLLLLAIGVVTQIAQVLLTRGIALVPAGRATAVGYVQIVFASFWGVVLFDEALVPSTILGALLVFVGTLVVALVPDRPSRA